MKPFLFLFLTFWSFTAFSSHVLGGEITYKYVGNTANPYQYEVTLSLIRDSRGAYMQAPYLKYSSSCFGADSVLLTLFPGTGVTIKNWTRVNRLNYPYACVNDSTGTDPLIFEIYIYRTIINLPGKCIDWRFSFRNCCRSASIVNLSAPNSQRFYLEAQLNNQEGPNSSATSSDLAARGLCMYQTTWYPRIYDAEGDSLHFSFGQPKGNVNDLLAFNTGYSINQPIKSNPPVSINPKNGAITVNPIQAGDVVVNILVKEYRYDSIAQNWYKVGSVSRDMQIPIYTSCFNNSLSSFISTDENYLIKTDTLNCGDTIISFYSMKAYIPESFAGDGSEFLVKMAGTTLPLQSFQIDPNSISRKIELQLANPLSTNDTVWVYLQPGSDLNTFQNECGHMFERDTLMYLVQGCSGAGLPNRSYLSKIFPNPAADLLRFTLSYHRDDVKLRILDNSGKILKNISLDPQLKEFKIGLQEFSPGIYYIQVIFADKIEVHKFIKE